MFACVFVYFLFGWFICLFANIDSTQVVGGCTLFVALKDTIQLFSQ